MFKKGYRVTLKDINIYRFSVGFLYGLGVLVYGVYVCYKVYLTYPIIDVWLISLLFIPLGVYSLGVYWCIHHLKSPFRLYFKRLYHKEMLARCLWNERLFLTEKRTDIFGKSYDKIVLFPKVYYKAHKGFIYIRFSLDLQRWQNRFLTIGKDLETFLYADVFDVLYEEGYVVYKFLYAPYLSRITVHEMQPTRDTIQLMEHVSWEYNKIPHGLIAGGTGSGKTYVLLSILYSFLKIKARVVVCDPKRSDLSYLKTIPALENYVFDTKEDIIMALSIFYEEMQDRMEEFNRLANYRNNW